MLPPDNIAGKYTLECQHPGCGGKLIAEQNHGVGWSVGTIVPMDPSVPTYGRCPRCKRYNLKVTKAPEPPPPAKPKGFTKIPTE